MLKDVYEYDVKCNFISLSGNYKISEFLKTVNSLKKLVHHSNKKNLNYFLHSFLWPIVSNLKRPDITFFKIEPQVHWKTFEMDTFQKSSKKSRKKAVKWIAVSRYCTFKIQILNALAWNVAVFEAVVVWNP